MFRSDFLFALDDFSARAQRLEAVEHVLSLTTVKDITAGEGGASLAYSDLIERAPNTGRMVLPTIRPGAAQLRARVMSRDLVVGQLVSADESSVLVYVFAVPGAEPRVLAAELKSLTEELFPDAAVHLGGAALSGHYS